jgi:hypothetical protein
MKSPSLAFRTSIYNALSNIEYLSQHIPVCLEYRNTPAAILPVGNNKQAKAWIQLTNQTADDNSNKCRRNDLVSIQIQVRVSYNANSGGYEHTEEIANLVLETLFPVQNDFDLTIEEPFNVWNLRMESDRNLNFSDDTDRVWYKSLLITAQVEQ